MQEIGHVCVNGASRVEGGGRADGLHTDGVVSSCIFHFFVGTKWLGAVMVSGERLGERGRKKERKERTGRGI